jgi:hypothetical protein
VDLDPDDALAGFEADVEAVRRAGVHLGRVGVQKGGGVGRVWSLRAKN